MFDEDSHLVVEEAPEPNDGNLNKFYQIVDWEFIHKSLAEKNKGVLLSWTLSVILMTCCFLLIMSLSVLQSKLTD